jgi:VWFA-related protein
MRHSACFLAAAAFTTAIVVTVSGQAASQTFRTTTRLVEVSVVVTDREGNPVTGLAREDFTLTEDRVKQPISIFQVNDARAADATAATASPSDVSRVFTNKVNDPSGAATVILLDRLNAAFASQWFARKHVDSYLKSSRAGDRIALYVLDGSMRVLHGFTSDHESLRSALEQYTVRPSAHYDASNEPPAATPAEGVAVWLADPAGNMAQFFTERRAMDTFSALRYLAGHLAGTAGRKSIVWLSEAFPMPTREGRQEFLLRMRAATQALSDAQVSLYPVDARGLIGAQTTSGAKVTFTTLSGVRGNIETMQVVAQETGGRAFANTNALDLSIRRALDDSRFTYLLGYYPSDSKWDGRYRSISVQVRQKGLTVRHRHGYVAAVPATDDRARNAALREALQGPLQSTKVGLQATAERLEGSQLKLSVRIDPSTVSLERDGTSWRGTVDVLIANVSPKGIGTIGSTAKLDITLTDQGRTRALREGLPVTRTIVLRPDTFQVRVIARDVASGDVGSIVIPASQLK